MATYAIGDIQGCYQTFRKLITKIDFDPSHDKLWIAGDMINRGPDSLSTMQYIMENQQHIQCVLGNHDLHFLAVANGCQQIHPKDTFSDILNSNMKEDIMDWFSHQPLAYFDPQQNTLMTHAGLPNNWSAKNAVAYSKEVSEYLLSSDKEKFYSEMYGNFPNIWNENLQGVNRLRYITNALTRMRYCHSDGSLELHEKSSPGNQPIELFPWFELENNSHSSNIVFGHWASLKGNCSQAHIYALDTGCVWGGYLTALRLEDKELFQVTATDYQV